MTQGRCTRCNVAYRWKGEPLLRNAACPRCRRPLGLTTHLLRSAPWEERTPIYRSTDGKGYLDSGDARAVAAIVREKLASYRFRGVSVAASFSKHEVRIAATRRWDRGDGTEGRANGIARVCLPTEEAVDRAIFCAVGFAAADHGPHTIKVGSCVSQSGHYADQDCALGRAALEAP